jgi:hypothetical protein
MFDNELNKIYTKEKTGFSKENCPLEKKQVD